MDAKICVFDGIIYKPKTFIDISAYGGKQCYNHRTGQTAYRELNRVFLTDGLYTMEDNDSDLVKNAIMHAPELSQELVSFD